MIRYLTAGESHGPELTGILEGIPAGFNVSKKYIDDFLQRRQKGLGSGGRMNIEQDEVLITSGIVNGVTTGAPIAIRILNKDWKNWKDKEIEPYIVPRPGHADLVGTAKYDHEDIRFVLERASARETAMRAAIGAITAEILESLGINIVGYVTAIGDISYQGDPKVKIDKLKVMHSKVGCPDPVTSKMMEDKILLARKNKDTLGGAITCIASGVPATLGSFVHWDKKLDAILAKQFMSVQSVKAVEIGKGVEVSKKYGTEVQDQYSIDEKKISKISNNLGGFEGGMSNGEDIYITAYLKPISTTLTPINSIDLVTKTETETVYERSDTCAVPRAIPIFEAVMAFEVLNNLLLKTGGDNKKEVLKNYNNIPSLEVDDFNMKNEVWNMNYDN
jgi:chorismate synthase